MAIDFTSPGASANDAITKFLIQRALYQRQQMLDAQSHDEKLKADDIASGDLKLRQGQEARIAGAQAETIKDAENQRNFTRANTISENALPGDAVDDPTRSLLTTQGFGGQMTKVPGIVAQGPQTGTDDNGVPQYQVNQSPDSYTMRGGSKYLSARAAEDARAAQAAATAAAAKDRADADRASRDQNAADALAGRADSQGLRNQLTEMQIQGMQDKRDATAKAQGDAANAVKTSRQGVRDLAQSILSDPALDGITGALQGRRDTFFDGKAIDEKTRLDQLIGQLSLQARGQMKGQGQISDFEGRLLANAVSAIDRAAGPEEVKKHLREIISSFSGDAPSSGPSTNTAGGTGGGFRVVGVR